jgi:hypothetical protein
MSGKTAVNRHAGVLFLRIQRHGASSRRLVMVLMSTGVQGKWETSHGPTKP